jgi:hypothetical protein
MKTYKTRLESRIAHPNLTLGNLISCRGALVRLRASLLAIVCLLAFSWWAMADFLPIPLRPDTFTHDVVIERTAPPPLVPVTSAGMDTGTNNTGYGWYERGYNLDYITTGLPAAGSIYTSELNMDYSFLFAPSYKSNNAVLIDSTLPKRGFGSSLARALQPTFVLVRRGGGQRDGRFHGSAPGRQQRAGNALVPGLVPRHEPRSDHLWTRGCQPVRFQ